MFVGLDSEYIARTYLMAKNIADNTRLIEQNAQYDIGSNIISRTPGGVDNQILLSDLQLALDNKSDLQKNIGLCVDTDSCRITNWNLQILNNLVDYIDKYHDYIEKYENGEYDANRKIKAINNYIKNINSVYNAYTKTAKKSYQNNEIDKEIYKFVLEDFKESLDKYKEKLNCNLQV